MILILRSALVVLSLMLVPAPLLAAVTINVVDDGTDTSVTATGTIDLTGMTPAYGSGCTKGGTFSATLIQIGTLDMTNCPKTNSYTTFSGPTSWSLGSTTSLGGGTSGGGALIGLSTDGTNLTFHIDQDYVSGAQILSTNVFATATLANTSLTPGSYVWTLGSGDTVTMNLGVTPVPLPAGGVLLVTGLAALAVWRGRRG